MKTKKKDGESRPVNNIVSWLFWINGKHKNFKARKHRITGKVEIWHEPLIPTQTSVGWIEIDRSWWNDFEAS